MTRKYTAADFANARFAEHPDGRTAMKSSGWEKWDVKFLDGHISTRGNYHMASFGWVPVPTKPQITYDDIVESFRSFKTTEELHRICVGLANLGFEVTAPEPTNTDRLEQLIRESDFKVSGFLGRSAYGSFAKYLNAHGVTAPNVKGN